MSIAIFEKAKTAIESGDYEQAMEILNPLAEAGNAEAQYQLGNMYWSTTANVDADWAKDWLSKAAAQEHAEAYYRLAALDPSGVYSPLPTHPECFKLLTKAAKLGSPAAQRALGFMYYHGEEKLALEPDYAQSRKWYQKAAENGEVIAQLAAGQMLLEGEGGSVNVDEGIHWLEQCAVNKEDYWSASDAVRLLQAIYNEGLYGIETDKEKAVYWKEVEESEPAVIGD